MAIFVNKDGQQYGPYELNDLSGYVAQGSFATTDLCWQEGWEEWKPLSTLVSSTPPVVPPPTSAPNPPAVSAPNQKQSEEVLWTGHANIWRYAGQFVVSLVVGITLGIITAGPGLLILPLWWGAIYLDRKKRRYIVTNKIVKVEFGMFSKSTKEVRIRDIKAVNVVKRGIAGLFGIGTLEFSSAGGAGVEVAFEGIENAQKIKDLVTGLQE
jgi:hypothetical protein